MITIKIKMRVYKYTEGVSTNYNLETNDYKVGTIYNWGKNKVKGNYKVSERGSINKSNLEEVTEFVESNIKKQFGKFGIEIEFIDLNEMFSINVISKK